MTPQRTVACKEIVVTNLIFFSRHHPNFASFDSYYIVHTHVQENNIAIMSLTKRNVIPTNRTNIKPGPPYENVITYFLPSH